MADTTALKNRIRAAIKANDNQEITGPVLQQALLDMVDELNGATETEAQQRQSSDSALQQTLQQNINNEAQTRQTADNGLTVDIKNTALINICEITNQEPQTLEEAIALVPAKFRQGLAFITFKANGVVQLYNFISRNPTDANWNNTAYWIKWVNQDQINTLITNAVNTEKTRAENAESGLTTNIAELKADNSYYVCDTASGNSNKSVNIPGYKLQTGGSLKIKFENIASTSTVNLNISSTGLRPLYLNGVQANYQNSWSAGDVLEIYYDGEKYQAINLSNLDSISKSNIGYSVCSTASGNQNKGVSINGFVLFVGGCIKIKFDNAVGNTSNVNLVINSTISKPLYYTI